MHSLYLYAGIWRDLFRVLKRQDGTDEGRRLFQEARHGSIKPTDAMIVASLVRKHKPRSILEIGSFLGVSTRLLLDASAPWKAQVTAVDPNIRHRKFEEPRRVVEKMTARYGSEQLEIVSAFFGKQTRAASLEVPVIGEDWGRSFDFVFIDGDHTYEAVSNNFRLALKFLTPNGVILLHDALSWPDVTRFLGEITEEFRGKATVSLLGDSHRKLLRLVGRMNDGIGYFRLL
jgi:predicted O-methyltransferase YrrM